MPDGSTAFGSRWEGGVVAMPQGWNLVQAGTITLASISGVLSKMYAFDHFVHNYDRHGKNFLFRQQAKGYAVLAFDYSRAWTFHGFPLPALPFNLTDPSEKTVRFQRQISTYVGKYIDNVACKEILAKIDSITERSIKTIIESHPSSWLPEDKKQSILAWWNSAERPKRIAGIVEGIENGTYL
jgi:hypothetical protein